MMMVFVPALALDHPIVSSSAAAAVSAMGLASSGEGLGDRIR
jgi:hypothetical protein